MDAWALPVLENAPPRNPEALSDVATLLDRLESAFGTRPIAKLLDVGPGMVTNWKNRRHRMSPEYARRVIELHDAFVRALQVFQPQVLMQWLVGNEPFLNGARPIDVLVTRGAAPLIDALAAVESTSYA